MLIQVALAAGTMLAATPSAPNSAGVHAMPSDSARAWLAAELRRMPGIVILAGCRLDFPAGSPPAPGRPGAGWRDIPLVSFRATAEGAFVRLIASDSAMRVTDNREVAGVARRLFNEGGLTLQASSKENAARVAGELNALALECAKAR